MTTPGRPARPSRGPEGLSQGKNPVAERLKTCRAPQARTIWRRWGCVLVAHALLLRAASRMVFMGAIISSSVGCQDLFEVGAVNAASGGP